MSNIHPTAIIDSQAKIAGDVKIGAFCTIEGPVSIGPGCIIQPHVRLLGPLTLGARNRIHSYAVLGDLPQDRKYAGEYSETVIGNDNWIREGATIHRGTGANTQTIIGDRNFFMCYSHVGHNCVLGNDIMLVNSALLGGFVQVSDRAIISGNSSIHQFCRVGRLAMVSNNSAQTVDMPPFMISMATNRITQLNKVGMHRAGISDESILAIRTAFRMVFRTGASMKKSIESLPAGIAAVPEVRELLDFVKSTKRGVAKFQGFNQRNQSDTPATGDMD